MQGVPWEPVPGREGMEVRAQVNIPSASEEVLNIVQGHERSKGFGDLGVTRKDVMKHDPTLGCHGCRALMENRSDSMGRGMYRLHTPECKQRFRELWEKRTPKSEGWMKEYTRRD